MNNIILTSKCGKNQDLFPDILWLYAKYDDIIADVTYGKGNFWKNIDTDLYRTLFTDIETGIDCRNLPYKNEEIDIVIFDPPYIYNPKNTIKNSISSSYNINSFLDLTSINKVIDFYKISLKEAWRVLKHGGFCIVKCQDQIESGKQRWMHIEIKYIADNLGFYSKDLFVLLQKSQPAIRWPIQKHARKNHSYFWIFEKQKGR